MRIPRARVVAVVAAVAALLLGGCELREGDPSEYGNAAANAYHY